MRKGTEKNAMVSMFAIAHPIAFGALALLISTWTFAAPAPEGWVDQRATLVSPEAAERLVGKREQSLARERARQGERQRQAGVAPMMTAQSAAVSAASEFAQLAAALQNDPRRIYQFVRNHFTYVPYYGALRKVLT